MEKVRPTWTRIAEKHLSCPPTPRAKRMKEGGFYTVLGVHMATKKQLANVKGISEVKVDKIREACIKVAPVGFSTGLAARDRRIEVFRITTGSPALDAILAGGIESRSITECYGAGRGKTITALSSCTLSRSVNVSLPCPVNCMFCVTFVSD